MKADLTRRTFRPERHYAGTVQQQGRVPMDADWNEQVDIQQHHDEIETIDVIGQTGVPEGTSFQVDALGNTELQLSPGRAYVDGILCELDAGTVPVTVNGAGTLTPLTWTIDGLALRLGEWVQISSSATDGKSYRITAMDPSTLLLTLAVGSDNLTTLFAGKTPSIRRVVTYTVQPEWWQPDYTTWTANAVPTFTPPAAGLYLAYLDVWRRHVTALEDSGIREIALGGPDTCTRMRTTWQLKLAQVGTLSDPITCATASPVLPVSTGQLSARALLPGNDTPCVMAPTARYRSLENQLYRVEVHTGGVYGAATFKFSQDNGTVVTSWIKQDGLNLYVGSTGKDSVLGLTNGDWVEIIDDSLELAGKPGVMTQITGVQTDYITISDATILIANFPLNPRIRKWDAALATVTQSGADGFLTLGTAGVQIKFEPGNYVTGDYWLIPARTISTDVEWPQSELGTPLPRPRFGIQHHYMHLALVAWNGTAFTVQEPDCRPQFPPLTNIHAKDVKMDPGPCNFDPTVKTVQDAISALCQEKANSCCELVIAPGADVATVVAQALQNNLANNIPGLHICFAAGTHTLRDTLVITAPANGGDITVSGCGLASKVTAPTVPTVIELVGWTTATVTDLTLVAGAAQRAATVVTAPTDSSVAVTRAVATSSVAPAARAAATTFAPVAAASMVPVAASVAPPPPRPPGPSGTLALRDCVYSVVERVWAVCPPFPRRVTSCIVVSAPTVGARASVRVTNCEVAVGNRQFGILVIGIVRSTVEGNRVEVVPFQTVDRTALLASHDYQGGLRDRMMSNLRIGTAAGHTVATNTTERRVHLTLNNVKMAFTADAAVASGWASYLASHIPHYLSKATRHTAVLAAPSSTSSSSSSSTSSSSSSSSSTDAGGGAKNPVPNPTAARVAMAMKRMVTDIVRTVSSVTQAQATTLGLGDFYTFVQAQNQAVQAVMTGAIVIAGSVAGDVRILDNSIAGAIDGIIAALQPAAANPVTNTTTATNLKSAINTASTNLALNTDTNTNTNAGTGLNINPNLNSAADTINPIDALVIAPRIVRSRIAGNTVVLSGPPRVPSIGIGLASCASTIIEDNWIDHTGSAASIGIAVTGLLGKMMRAQGNHTISTTVGIEVRPQKPASGGDPSLGALWILSQNAAVGATTPILAPATVVRINNAP
jgi:hypothetical protein